MKIAGSIMITGFTFLISLEAIKFKKAQVKYIDSLIYIAERIKLLLNSVNAETSTIMSELMLDENLSDFDFAVDKKTFILPESEQKRIINFFNSLGRYDTDSMIDIVDEFSNYYKMIKTEYSKDYSKHYKLYISFGLFSGLIFCLLFI